jgi:transposase-like protein
MSSAVQFPGDAGLPAPGPPEGLVDGPQSGPLDPAARPVRRSFTAAYRAKVVAEYEAAPHGHKAAVLRREGLYQSQIREWLFARDKVSTEAAAPRSPRRPHRRVTNTTGNPSAGGGSAEVNRLRVENQRLTRELAKSQAVVSIMGKLQGLLEAISESTDTPTPPTPR